MGPGRRAPRSSDRPPKEAPEFPVVGVGVEGGVGALDAARDAERQSGRAEEAGLAEVLAGHFSSFLAPSQEQQGQRAQGEVPNRAENALDKRGGTLAAAGVEVEARLVRPHNGLSIVEDLLDVHGVARLGQHGRVAAFTAVAVAVAAVAVAARAAFPRSLRWDHGPAVIVGGGAPAGGRLPAALARRLVVEVVLLVVRVP
mmetsp:Transcript_3452/g.12560  ORF Transcript_3452/g.12560 Transcript_3452/m.12560 type:complete len:200 (-) Transcript_3452:83-682(-)